MWLRQQWTQDGATKLRDQVWHVNTPGVGRAGENARAQGCAPEVQGRTVPCPHNVTLPDSLPNYSASLPQATSNQTPITKKALNCVLPSSSPQPGPPAPRNFAQHLPAGPGPPVWLLIPPVPLSLWPVPLGGLLRGTRTCWAPTLPDFSFLASRDPAPLCGSEQVWTSCSAWGSFHPRGCSELPDWDTGLSWAPGLGLSTHMLFPGPGLLGPPRERSRGTKSVFCGEPGTGLGVEK